MIKLYIANASEFEVDEGVNLHLLIYLLTLCRDKRREFLDSVGCKGDALIPAGMLYCVTKPPETEANLS